MAVDLSAIVFTSLVALYCFLKATIDYRLSQPHAWMYGLACILLASVGLYEAFRVKWMAALGLVGIWLGLYYIFFIRARIGR